MAFTFELLFNEWYKGTELIGYNSATQLFHHSYDFLILDSSYDVRLKEPFKTNRSSLRNEIVWF